MGTDNDDSSLGLGWLPLITSLSLPITFLITYVWSVLRGDTEPDFPYISSTGADPPESCFFGQMLNIISLLMGITVWIRHKIVLDFCSKNVTNRKLPKWSRWAAYVGYAAAFGPSLVGNFQSSNVGSIHVIGAVLAFGVGNLYIWFQTVMSYSLEPYVNSRMMSHLRVACSVVCTCMNILTVIFSILFDTINANSTHWGRGPYWMYERDHWPYHVVATGSEWFLAGSFSAVILTFVPEFKRASFRGAVVELDRDRQQVRRSNIFESVETISSRL